MKTLHLRLEGWRRAGARAWILSAFVGVAPHGASAVEPSAAPSLEAGAPALAEARYVVGRKLYAEGDFAGAVREFTSALDIFPTSAKLAFNLGRSCERLDDPECARRAYRRYQENAPDAPDRAEMDRLIAGLERRLEETLPILAVTSTPSGATVQLDETPPNGTRTPATLRLPPGPHLVRFTLAGYPEAVRSTNLTRGQTSTLDVVFGSPGAQALAPAPAPAPAPNAVVTRTPAPAAGIPPWIGWGMVGLGATSLAAGAWFWGQAVDTADRAEGLGRSPAELKRHAALEDDHGTQVTIALTATLGGALAAAGGAALLLVAPAAPDAATVGFAPVPGGAVVTGRF